jgi:hypothetical protein
LEALLATEHYREVRPFVMTTYERGKNEGRAEGRAEERRDTGLPLLKARFGPLSPTVRERVEAFSAEQLRQLLPDFVRASSLKDLHLED